MPQPESRSKIDPRYYRPFPAKPDKAEREKPKPMTTDLPEQKELDAFYAGQRARLSLAVLDRLFTSAPTPQPSMKRPKMRRTWGEWQKMERAAHGS